ncbi:hypothetical protein ABH892_005452 [Paenibacillus sp. RC254]|uniref:hypothetical protein n=1 Tax=unclassified Paenibacillus TaxID=185978 RepID=UPI0024B8AD42|nr:MULTISPECIES: hypothetical protein [unclassified Paenibacillus]
MNFILNSLTEIYLANLKYIGDIKSDMLENEKNFDKWMSSFVVRRVRKDLFSKEMKYNSIVQQSSSITIEQDIQQLLDKNLIIKVNNYLVITEFGIIVQLMLLKDNGYLKDLEHYCLEAYPFLSRGISKVAINKIEKLFPLGLSTKELIFVVFLLLNGAYSKNTAFVIKESTQGFDFKIDAVVSSLKYICAKLFDETVDFSMEEKEFSNFLRRNTANGTIGRIFNTKFFSQYDKLEGKRTIYFDLLKAENIHYEEDYLNDLINNTISILLKSTSSIIDNYTLLCRLRELVVEFLVRNQLDAHQQLIYFNNVNYRDSLFPLLSIIDQNISLNSN